MKYLLSALVVIMVIFLSFFVSIFVGSPFYIITSIAIGVTGGKVVGIILLE